jgi:hypothetical protein
MSAPAGSPVTVAVVAVPSAAKVSNSQVAVPLTLVSISTLRRNVGDGNFHYLAGLKRI